MASSERYNRAPVQARTKRASQMLEGTVSSRSATICSFTAVLCTICRFWKSSGDHPPGAICFPQRLASKDRTYRLLFGQVGDPSFKSYLALKRMPELSWLTSHRIWEYIWQFVFSDPVFCPAEQSCYCDVYGLCFSDEDIYFHFLELLDMKERLRSALWAHEGTSYANQTTSIQQDVLDAEIEQLKVEALENGSRNV